MYFVQHYKYVHGGIPPGFEDKEKFMCDQCPSVFFNNLSLKLHYKTKHSDIVKDPAKGQEISKGSFVCLQFSKIPIKFFS